MKLILASSIIAMISAGIYGAFDFGSDVKHGTLIDYHHTLHLAHDVGEHTFFSSASGEALKQQVVQNIARKREEIKKKLQKSVKEFSYKLYSREEPPISDEEMARYKLELHQLDSLEALQNVKPVVHTTSPKTSRINP